MDASEPAPSVLVVHAHPYPRRSRAGKALLHGVESLAGVTVRSLYDRYPDFGIDIEAEQAALAAARVVVWQSPLFWYGMPALFSLWFEKVLAPGFAYGDGGHALTAKPLLWVVTAGTPQAAYRETGMHGHRFEAFSHSVEQTARFCGMRWEPPLVLFDVHQVSEENLALHARTYRARLELLMEQQGKPGGA